MAANGISTLPTKEERQLAKLELAADDRAATGRRSVYDISELPTKYVGNTVYNNVNEGGLVQGRPWATTETPDSIAGLRFWIDTATTSTLNGGTYTDGAALTAWTERKQNAAFAVQATNRKPTIQSGAGDLKNGYPVVRFTNPAGDWDQAEWTSVSGFANATGYTMVCMVKFAVNPNAGQSFILRIRNSDGTYSAGIFYASVAGRWEMTAPTGSVYVDNTVDPDDTWKIVSVRYDSTQAVAANRYTFRWAKTARTVTNQATPPSGALAATAGNNIFLGYFSVADWAEMMVYNTALSDAQIIALEDYLSSKGRGDGGGQASLCAAFAQRLNAASASSRPTRGSNAGS